MPYINQDRRTPLDTGAATPQTSGELNYLLTKAAIDYALEHGFSYAIFNDVIGALGGAKQEFYRRLVAPYEDNKIVENGDVYPELWMGTRR